MSTATNQPQSVPNTDLALSDLIEACELTEATPTVMSSGTLDDQLANARTDLQELMSDQTLPMDVRQEACRQLYRIHLDQTRRLNERVTRSVTTATEVRQSVAALTGKSTDDLIEAVPKSMCHDLAFERAMVSSVHGSIWIPRHTFFAQLGDPTDLKFARYADAVHIPLVEAPLETEIVRNRTATMINSPDADKRTFKELISMSQSSGYVAAPIISRGKTIGMLHADRPAGKGSVSIIDLETLSSFAECLSLLFESAVMAERLRTSTRSLNHEFIQLSDELEQLAQTDYDYVRAAGAVNTQSILPTSNTTTSSATSFLTAREREVLSHMATGATNVQIARALVISEETVKSHLKLISRKLGTSTRSAAVAKFAHLTRNAVKSR